MYTTSDADKLHRLYVDRISALLDQVEDIRALLPPTPHSMSSTELRIASACCIIRTEAQVMMLTLQKSRHP